MDIRALVLVKTVAGAVVEPIQLSPLSPALLEVVGMSPLQRTIERLKNSGIQAIKIISDSDFLPLPAETDGDGASAGQERFWRAAENAFNDLAQEGADLVLLVSLDNYAEINFEKLVQFHLDQQARVTQVGIESRLLQVFCISASRRNDAASLFRSQLTKCRSECPVFEHTGYFNSLSSSRDLRQLAIDILTLKVETRPAGTEVRPGVWIEDGAIIEKGARVLAPAFVGTGARIRTHVVITRCTSVEHHARIDCGTVLENSTVLPYCCVGAALDVAHSVVSGSAIANLRRDVTVEILDPKLVTSMLAAPGERLLKSAVEFATYLPKQIWRGLFGKSQPQQSDLQTGLRQTSPSLGKAAGYQAPACDTHAAEKFPSNLAIVRRYGHQ